MDDFNRRTSLALIAGLLLLGVALYPVNVVATTPAPAVAQHAVKCDSMRWTPQGVVPDCP